jgi:superfamily II DNA or RNA helicase
LGEDFSPHKKDDMNSKPVPVSKRCSLAPVFALEEIAGDNQIRELFEPSQTYSVLVEPYEQPECRGFRLTRISTDPVTILLILDARQPAQRQRIDRAVPASFSRILGIAQPELSLDDDPIDLTAGIWIRHPGMVRGLVDFLARRAEILESWRGAFSFVEEGKAGHLDGLRAPQVGAIHTVYGHWTTSSETATIVMPTGTGKTEVMLAVLVSQCCDRLLVVVPTDALRTQIGERFLSHGILKRIGAIAESACYPIVGLLRNRPKSTEEVDTWFEKCNVVITTMNIAGQCSPEVQQRMAFWCSHLFIDEAHHIGADTWAAFREHFKSKPILQFTATPFRNDERLVDGKIIFNYPLKKALEEGYFKPIHFNPVEEYDPLMMDRRVVQQAVAQLEEDLDAGFNHILMARVESIKRAAEIYELYAKYPQFNPVQLHSEITREERERVRAQIFAGETRIIVCVDMLGEGFDLPELKIAAFHDIKKSLPITLQLTGRFTRARNDLGSPTVIANIGDAETRDELHKLYSQDADWNSLLPKSSETVIHRQVELLEFLQGFKDKPRDFPLQNLRPTLYTTVFKTENCTTWRPEKFEEGLENKDTIQHLEKYINREKDTLVILLARKLPVDWADIQDIYSLEWELIVVFWDRDQKLLFINSSGCKSYFRKLAQAIMGKEGVIPIKDRDLVRSFSGITRLRLQNIGVRRLPGGNITYSMYAGPDVLPGLSTSQKSKSSACNMSGAGYEGGQRVSLGCSTAGRVWARTPRNLSGVIEGCRHVGRKILDTSINPDKVLSGMLIPKIIKERPKKIPIGIEWPELFTMEPEASIYFLLQREKAKNRLPLFQTDIRLLNPSENGALEFEVVSDAEEISRVFSLSIHSSGYSISGGSSLSILHGGYERSLKTFFEDHPPIIWFHDGSFLEGNRYVELPMPEEKFDLEKIDASWDWSGVDIHKESQYDRRKAPPLLKEVDSIQYSVIQRMIEKKVYSLVFDDDDTGESADVVCVKDHKDRLEVEFYHCKYAKGKEVGTRVEDLYEVCGQAQKSVQWASKPEELFNHLLKRDPRVAKKGEQTISRFERGSRNTLNMLRNKSLNMPVHFRIYIVQPGMSKSNATDEQLILLGVTEDYLLDTYHVHFGVICSL